MKYTKFESGVKYCSWTCEYVIRKFVSNISSLIAPRTEMNSTLLNKQRVSINRIKESKEINRFQYMK